jgi:DNA-binding NtrC family response regulator
MRRLFAQLVQVAGSKSTVLLEGETGTGKSAAAESVHLQSPRKDGPFVVVDCGAVPPSLLESELFGHERGAFTGAQNRRQGAFEAAQGGTLFLDEIGELPVDLQPKLLRVLETRTIKRIGSNQSLPVDVRVIAATNRDLRTEVNAGRFRADLYYRLAVVTLRLPPLRERPEDIEDIVARLLDDLEADEDARVLVTSPPALAQLRQGAWPGNVRELRNHLERCIVLRSLDVSTLPLASTPEPAGATGADDDRPYAHARQLALDEFERRYVARLLERAGGRVADAARKAGLNRTYLSRLMARHGLGR